MKILKQNLIALAALASLGSAQAAVVMENQPNGNAGTAQFIADGAFTTPPVVVIERNDVGDLGVPNATVLGSGGDNTFDYYSFNVGSTNPLKLGNEVYFDTDYAEINGLDTYITLFDTDGISVLDSNDDADFDGPGDLIEDTLNSFLSYTFLTSGEYFIRVGEFDFESESEFGGELETQASYQLHISSVPLPPAVWLFVSGIIAIVAIARRRSRTIASAAIA